MSTLSEIEAAIAVLPFQEQVKLSDRLRDRLDPGPSCYDLVRDLFEKPEQLVDTGLSDHSTNKNYLADLGQKAKLEIP